jgi:hypothetical protein
VSDLRDAAGSLSSLQTRIGELPINAPAPRHHDHDCAGTIVRTKHQTPAQRVTNPVWLRRQLGELVRGCATNIERNQKLADTAASTDRRKVHLDRIKDYRYWQRQLERILQGKTPAEELDEFLQHEGVGR